MIWYFFVISAFAGGFIVDAQVPVELRIGEQAYVKLYYPGQTRMEFASGEVDMTVLVNGNPSSVRMNIPETGYAQLVVGRNGTSIADKTIHAEIMAESPVTFRAVGRESVQIRLNNQKHLVSPEREFKQTLATGTHKLEIRNEGGTLVWAKGVLNVSGKEPVVLQLSEGRLPEVIGLDSEFSSSGW